MSTERGMDVPRIAPGLWLLLAAPIIVVASCVVMRIGDVDLYYVNMGLLGVYIAAAAGHVWLAVRVPLRPYRIVSGVAILLLALGALGLATQSQTDEEFEALVAPVTSSPAMFVLITARYMVTAFGWMCFLAAATVVSGGTYWLCRRLALGWPRVWLIPCTCLGLGILLFCWIEVAVWLLIGGTFSYMLALAVTAVAVHRRSRAVRKGTLLSLPAEDKAAEEGDSQEPQEDSP